MNPVKKTDAEILKTIREYAQSSLTCQNVMNETWDDEEGPTYVSILECPCDRFAHDDSDGTLWAPTVLRILDGGEL